MKSIFIGYAENGYLCWDPLSNKVRVARNVKFDESRNYTSFDMQSQSMSFDVCVNMSPAVSQEN